MKLPIKKRQENKISMLNQRRYKMTRPSTPPPSIDQVALLRMLVNYGMRALSLCTQGINNHLESFLLLF